MNFCYCSSNQADANRKICVSVDLLSAYVNQLRVGGIEFEM